MLARAKQYCIMLGPPYSFLSICATPQASISSNVSNDARMSDGKYPSHVYKVRMVPGEGKILVQFIHVLLLLSRSLHFILAP